MALIASVSCQGYFYGVGSESPADRIPIFDGIRARPEADYLTDVTFCAGVSTKRLRETDRASQ